MSDEAKMIKLLERRLGSISTAASHPYWNNSDDVILIGDNGVFVNLRSQTVEGQVVGIDAESNSVRVRSNWLNPSDVDTYDFKQCDKLVSRGRLATDVEIEKAGF